MTGFKTFGVLAVIGALALTGCKTTEKIRQSTESNPGPCPRAFALYDAARIVEFRGDGSERFSNVGFTGEIDKVRSLCRYVGGSPIDADLTLDFSLGRGPAATESTATYEYFVAVTRRNVQVIEKEVFPLQVTFPAGVERVQVQEKIDSIIIPRADDTTSGVNFEVVIGFVVTPQQRLFNAEGKRFRLGSAGDGLE